MTSAFKVDRWSNSAGQIANEVFRWIAPKHLDGHESAWDQNQVQRNLIHTSFTEAESLALYGMLAAISECAAQQQDELQSDADAGNRATLARKWLGIHTREATLLEQCVQQVLSKHKPVPRPHTVIVETPNELKKAINAFVLDYVGQAKLYDRVSLKTINISAIRHPEDTSDGSRHGSDLFSVSLAKLADIDKQLTLINSVATGILVGRDSTPGLWNTYLQAGELFGIDPACMPPLYLKSGGGTSAHTVGVDNPIILLDSMAASLFDEREIAFVLGREIGHILAGHTFFLTAGAAKQAIKEGILENLPIVQQIVQYYDRWQSSAQQRTAAWTADRFGYLVCQSKETALRVLMKQSGYPRYAYADIDTRAFARQAQEFEEQMHTNGTDRLITSFAGLTQQNGFPIIRTAKLLDWIESDGKAILADQLATNTAS